MARDKKYRVCVYFEDNTANYSRVWSKFLDFQVTFCDSRTAKKTKLNFTVKPKKIHHCEIKIHHVDIEISTYTLRIGVRRSKKTKMPPPGQGPPELDPDLVRPPWFQPPRPKPHRPINGTLHQPRL